MLAVPCNYCGKRTMAPPPKWFYPPACPCCRQRAERGAVESEIRFEGKTSTLNKREIFCPWCAEVYEAADGSELYNEGEHTVACKSCGGAFYLTTNVYHTFDTERVEEQE